MKIRLKNLTVSYGVDKILNGFDLELTDGVTALLGPSGCGKTTLLNTIAGLIKPSLGSVEGMTIDTVVGTKPARLSMVFNEPRLLPWYNAIKNVQIADNTMTEEEIRKLLKALQADEFAEKYPPELSAGMMQRVSIARALAHKGDVLLMDEPFKAVDPELKAKLMVNTVKLFKGKILLFVTHDPREAALIADRVLTAEANPLEIVKDEDNIDKGF